MLFQLTFRINVTNVKHGMTRSSPLNRLKSKDEINAVGKPIAFLVTNIESITFFTYKLKLWHVFLLDLINCTDVNTKNCQRVFIKTISKVTTVSRFQYNLYKKK